MKKNTCETIIRSFCLFVVFTCVFLFSACGLENYITIEEPGTVTNMPSVESGFDSMHFEFFTNERNDPSFKGTDVYYKIFNNLSTMESQAATLDNLANNDETKINSASTMIQNNKYQRLKCDGIGNDPLIPSKSSVPYQRVRIRLTDYLTEEYKACVTIDDALLGKPVRNDGSFTFNFGRTSEGVNNIVPGTDEASEIQDYYKASSATKEGVWYVDLFAVSVGMDTSFSKFYSNIKHLGSVKIVEGEPN